MAYPSIPRGGRDGLALKEFQAGEKSIHNEGRTPPQSHDLVINELLRILGPLVGPMLQDQDAHLDISRLPTESFQDFRSFLITQVKIDGIAFNEHLLNSYHWVLSKEKHEPLLRGLYRFTKDPQALTSKEQEDLGVKLKALVSDLIEVSAERFVGSHLRTPEGRNHLKEILTDPQSYGFETRVDLVKAIALVGRNLGTSRQAYLRLTEQVSVWNYGNIRVTAEELKQATSYALEIMGEVEHYQDQDHNLYRKYFKTPGQVTRFSGLERTLGREITDREIREHALTFDFNRENLNPKNQLESKLAAFWLTLVDEERWTDSGALKTAENVAFLLKETERFQKRLGEIKTAAEFVVLSDEIRDFLKGGLGVKGQGFFRDVKDFVSVQVGEVFRGMPEVHRQTFDGLLQFVEEIHYATEMGLPVDIDLDGRVLSSGSLRRSGGSDRAKPDATQPSKSISKAKHQFIFGLQQAQRALWYQYKQHRAFSRSFSNMAKVAGRGDIVEIEAGQRVIGEMIRQVQEAKTENDIRRQVKHLQKHLREEGKLHLAFRAAEMDGTEQLLGLAQTILIIMATRGALRGLGRLSAALARTQSVQRITQFVSRFKDYRLGQVIHRGMQNNVFAWRATKGFALGAWITTAENGVAVLSDEARPEGDNAKSWALDALSTGLAMGVFTTAASYLGTSLERSLFKRMLGRYFGSFHAPMRLVGDAIAETGEEVVDATIRSKLVDPDAALGFDQFREIALVSALGGFTELGLVAEIVRGDPKHSTPPGGGTFEKGIKPANPHQKISDKAPLGLFHDSALLGRGSLLSLGIGLTTLLRSQDLHAATEMAGNGVKGSTLQSLLSLLGVAALGGAAAVLGKGKNQKRLTLRGVKAALSQSDCQGDLIEIVEFISRSRLSQEDKRDLYKKVALHPHAQEKSAEIFQRIEEIENNKDMFYWILRETGMNPLFQGDANDLLNRIALKNLGLETGEIISALGAVGSNPNFNGDFSLLINLLRHFGQDPNHLRDLAKAAWEVAANPRLDGDFDGLLDLILRVYPDHSDPDFRDALIKIGSNPRFKGDFHRLLCELGLKIPHSEKDGLALAQILANPNFQFDKDQLVAWFEPNGLATHRFQEVANGLWKYASDPKFHGNFAKLWGFTEIFAGSYGSRSLIAKLQELKRFEKKGAKAIVGLLNRYENNSIYSFPNPIFLIRYLGLLATQELKENQAPPDGPARRALSSLFRHPKPNLRSLMAEVASATIFDPSVHEKIKDDFRSGLEDLLIDPSQRVKRAAQKVKSLFPGIFAFGAGLTTLLTPEIANSAVDLGSAVASNGPLSGLLAAAGVAATGLLAMAFNNDGDNGDDKEWEDFTWLAANFFAAELLNRMEERKPGQSDWEILGELMAEEELSFDRHFKNSQEKQAFWATLMKVLRAYQESRPHLEISSVLNILEQTPEELHPLMEQVLKNPQDKKKFARLTAEMGRHRNSWTIMLDLAGMGHRHAADYLIKLCKIYPKVAVAIVQWLREPDRQRWVDPTEAQKKIISDLVVEVSKASLENPDVREALERLYLPEESEEPDPDKGGSGNLLSLTLTGIGVGLGTLLSPGVAQAATEVSHALSNTGFSQGVLSLLAIAGAGILGMTFSKGSKTPKLIDLIKDFRQPRSSRLQGMKEYRNHVLQMDPSSRQATEAAANLRHLFSDPDPKIATQAMEDYIDLIFLGFEIGSAEKNMAYQVLNKMEENPKLFSPVREKAKDARFFLTAARNLSKTATFEHLKEVKFPLEVWSELSEESPSSRRSAEMTPTNNRILTGKLREMFLDSKADFANRRHALNLYLSHLRSNPERKERINGEIKVLKKLITGPPSQSLLWALEAYAFLITQLPQGVRETEPPRSVSRTDFKEKMIQELNKHGGEDAETLGMPENLFYAYLAFACRTLGSGQDFEEIRELALQYSGRITRNYGFDARGDLTSSMGLERKAKDLLQRLDLNQPLPPAIEESLYLEQLELAIRTQDYTQAWDLFQDLHGEERLKALAYLAQALESPEFSPH